MDYFAPSTIEDAVRLLDEVEDARVLAGGQSLSVMMNLGVVEPERLVSLRNLPSLRGIDRLSDGSSRIGAMTTHEVLAGSELPGAGIVLAETARVIGSPAIRSFGTIGGTISHADPATDWPAAVVALDAEIEVLGPGGTRRMPAETFFVGELTTALEHGELVVAIHVPDHGEDASGHYLKYARVHSDYATVAVAVVLAMEGDACSRVRIALGGCGPTPVRSVEAEACLADSRLAARDLDRAGELLRDASDPVDDVRGSAEYRRRIIPGLVARAVSAAADKQRVAA